MELNLGDKVVYQIYPKSFRDSDGDGIGDLRGVTEKLDYLEELGVDYLWLTPFFPSLQYDNGYDITDYRGIDPMYGTMDDFDLLVMMHKGSVSELLRIPCLPSFLLRNG